MAFITIDRVDVQCVFNYSAKKYEIFEKNFFFFGKNRILFILRRRAEARVIALILESRSFMR